MLDDQVSTDQDDRCVSVAPREAAPGSVPEMEIKASLQALAKMNRSGLRTEWRRLYRSNPPERISRDLLLLAVAWKLQEKTCGGLTAATKNRIGRLAKTLEEEGNLGRSCAVRLKPGAQLIRQWRGETHTVEVLEDGFEWRGARHRSLSSVARTITGTRWSGPRFFGLKPKTMRAEQKEVGNA